MTIWHVLLIESKTFNKLMQINKCLSFKQIMFLNISLNNINKKLIKYKKYNLKNFYTYTGIYHCDRCIVKS